MCPNWLCVALVLVSLVGPLTKADPLPPPFPVNPAYDCPRFKLNRSRPVDINDVSPADIRVVMSLGDSITAAFGALGRNGITHILNEYRGLSFSSGGDENATSLFNAFKHFANQTYGGSVGMHFIEKPGMPYHPALDRLNAAQSSAQTSHLGIQIEYLVKQMAGNYAPVKDEWKYLSLFIGANDVCGNCFMSVDEQVGRFEKNFKAALTNLSKHFNKMIVGVIPIFNISGVYTLQKQSYYCIGIHALPWECRCVLTDDAELRERSDIAAARIRERIDAVVAAFPKNETFGVTVLPFTKNVRIDDLPIEFLSDLDCFHPSLFSQQLMMVTAWNQLLVPPELRKTTWSLDETLNCPTPEDRIRV